jgi:predicted restriction endonuclease
MNRIYGLSAMHNIHDTDVLLDLLKQASRMAASLPDSPVKEYEQELKKLSLDETEVRREVEQRVGQNIYRDHMLQYWNGSCALTGIKEKSLLMASHAKPWKDCTSAEERLSVFNGFLLEARFDKLFDQGFITFDDEGFLISSEALDKDSLQKLGIISGMKLQWIRSEHLPFLQWHREKVFIKG